MAVKKVGSEDSKPVRNRCPDCCFYIKADGQWQKEANEDGTIRLSFIPGMRFYHDPGSKDLYQRIGTFTPCECPSGKIVRHGYESEEEKSESREAA